MEIIKHQEILNLVKEYFPDFTGGIGNIRYQPTDKSLYITRRSNNSINEEDILLDLIKFEQISNPITLYHYRKSEYISRNQVTIFILTQLLCFLIFLYYFLFVTQKRSCVSKNIQGFYDFGQVTYTKSVLTKNFITFRKVLLGIGYPPQIRQRHAEVAE